MENTSRRSFIKGSVAGAVAVASGSFASAAVAQQPKTWDETVDVIVIGSGFAGLAAAIEAKKAGANVVVLEKMPTAGGNSIINGGILTATGCPQQKMHKIQDSKELLEKDILVAGNYMNDPKKVRQMVDRVLSNYEWTVNELGVEYLPDAIGQEGGHSVPRYVTTKIGSGAGIVNKELEKCKELGIPVRTRTYVDRIIRTPEGVQGVEVFEGYRFPKAGSGKPKSIKANKGVVRCYGGFSADVPYRTIQDPKLNATLDTTNQPGATSELWRETSNIGCMQAQNDWIQCGPWGNPHEKGMGIGWQFNQTAAAEYGLWTNSAGKRFVNELANRKVRADAIMVEQANGRKCFAIADANGVKPFVAQRPGMLDKQIERKLVMKYDTIDDMAKAQGIDPEQLKKTIAEFNGYVTSKNDPVLGRYINNEQLPVETAPCYIGELQPKVHHSMGGLITDDQCRVLDVKTDKPIKGLYAAGEATGHVHGAVRLGSVAILDCLVFGRMAGENCAKS